MKVIHPIIPFKHHQQIIEFIANAVIIEYGEGKYDLKNKTVLILLIQLY